jgi:hypothetical protein
MNRPTTQQRSFFCLGCFFPMERALSKQQRHYIKVKAQRALDPIKKEEDRQKNRIACAKYRAKRKANDLANALRQKARRDQINLNRRNKRALAKENATTMNYERMRAKEIDQTFDRAQSELNALFTQFLALEANHAARHAQEDKAMMDRRALEDEEFRRIRSDFIAWAKMSTTASSKKHEISSIQVALMQNIRKDGHGNGEDGSSCNPTSTFRFEGDNSATPSQPFNFSNAAGSDNVPTFNFGNFGTSNSNSSVPRGGGRKRRAGEDGTVKRTRL